MSWNHRVMKRTREDITYYEVVEVFYDKEGNVQAWSEAGRAPYGETSEELRVEIYRFARAFYQPVLDEKELERESEMVSEDSEETL